MPRASRHFLSGHLWHITHRCHRQAFLLKFAKDRDCYRRWLFEAKKRFGLCVLNYVVTSNHIHLIVQDTAPDVIARSMQLIAGRTAQAFNLRKGRTGAFWEDRYHATAIEVGEHMHRCLVYIDLNMVRAGVVKHPAQWVHGGYHEIQAPPRRYGVIDLPALVRLCGLLDTAEFQGAHRRWVDEAIACAEGQRVADWSEALAVGSHRFVEEVKVALGIRARYRQATNTDEGFALREPIGAYDVEKGRENGVLRGKNTVSWERSVDES